MLINIFYNVSTFFNSTFSFNNFFQHFSSFSTTFRLLQISGGRRGGGAVASQPASHGSSGSIQLRSWPRTAAHEHGGGGASQTGSRGPARRSRRSTHDVGRRCSRRLLPMAPGAEDTR
jgi:hypothetical protein